MLMDVKRKLIAFLCVLLAIPAFAAYPEQPIKLIVPYPAGGNGDIIARVFAKALSDNVQRPVVVENKPGASGVIGATEVARAKPDGYTLLFTVTTQLSNQSFNVKPSYDATRDFEPIIGVTKAPLVLAVSKESHINDIKELGTTTKREPFSYGSYGAGTSTHVLPYLLSRQLGIEMIHVPYRGENPLITDLMGGRINMGLLSLNRGIELARSGKVILLGVVGNQRSVYLPDVPTLTEQGYRNMDWSYGTAVYASAGVPKEIRQVLHEKSKEAMQDPALVTALDQQRNELWKNSTPQQLKTRLVEDTKNWKKVLGQLGNIE